MCSRFLFQLGLQRKLFSFIAILIMAVFLLIQCIPSLAIAQTEVPLEAQSGIIEKSLSQTAPKFEPPPETEAPKITNKNEPLPTETDGGPKFFVKKIKLTGNTVISDEILMPIIDLGEGRDVDLMILNIMANKITALYSSKGYLLARAFVPKQEILDDTVEMVITEGRINKVLVQGNKILSKENIKGRMKMVQEEGVLQEQTLERVLLELNEMMGVSVTTVLKPGDLPGTSDLVLEVTESQPYTFSFDSNNFGSVYTGPVGFGYSGTYANIFTLGDQFSARYTTSNKELHAYSPSYTFPINAYGTRAKVSYTFSENELGYTLSALAAGGSSHSIGLEISQLLHKSRTASFSARLGLDIKSSTNEASGTNTSKDNLVNVSLGFGGDLTDSYLGRTFYDLKFQLGLSEEDTTRALGSRAAGTGEVFSTNINLTRMQSTVFLNSYLILKLTGQIDNTRALSPYLYGVGGMGTVRGYPISAYSGDMGFNVSGEHTIPFPWSIKWDNTDLSQVVSFISFLEHGQIYIRDEQPGEVDQHITGAGGGLKITLPKKNESDVGINFAITYGTPVFKSIPPTDGSTDFVYLNGMINY